MAGAHGGVPFGGLAVGVGFGGQPQLPVRMVAFLSGLAGGVRVGFGGLAPAAGAHGGVPFGGYGRGRGSGLAPAAGAHGDTPS